MCMDKPTLTKNLTKSCRSVIWKEDEIIHIEQLPQDLYTLGGGCTWVCSFFFYLSRYLEVQFVSIFNWFFVNFTSCTASTLISPSLHTCLPHLQMPNIREKKSCGSCIVSVYPTVFPFNYVFACKCLLQWCHLSGMRPLASSTLSILNPH